MNKKEAVKVLKNAGIEAIETVVVKNGREVIALQVGDGQVRPSIYQECLDSIESEEELIEFAQNAIASAPAFDTKELCTKEYFMNNAITCVRHQTEDESIVKFPVYGDLEEYIRILVDVEDDAIGSIVLTNEQVNKLEIDVEEIRKIAREHLKEKVVIRSMFDVMNDLIGEIPEGMPIPEVPAMYVASTTYGTNGAAVMLLEDVLSEFCKNHGVASLVVIPSSVHEVIIISNESADEEIDAMINDVNAEHLKEDEILSSHCYHFSITSSDVDRECA